MAGFAGYLMDGDARGVGNELEVGGPGGRCPPDPLGFIALGLLQQGVEDKRAGRFQPAPPCCWQAPRSALGSHPCVALSSAGAKGVFPVSVSLGVYRAGNGKRGFELIARGVAHDFSAGARVPPRPSTATAVRMPQRLRRCRRDAGWLSPARAWRTRWAGVGEVSAGREPTPPPPTPKPDPPG